MINEELIKLQEEWLRKVGSKFFELNHEVDYSDFFSFGITEFCSKRNIMVIGQQAQAFGYFKTSQNNLNQKWAIDYVTDQLNKVNNNRNSKYNASPFWNFNRKLNANGFNIWWNNLDKFHKYTNNKTKSLSVEEELFLHTKFGLANKSLLLQEIDISMPDAIVFVTGPRYVESMAWATNIPIEDLKMYTPTIKQPITEVSNIIGLNCKVFWTYHPAFLNRKTGMLNYVINKIIELIDSH